MRVEVGGLDIAYERVGSGPPVALTHGLVGDGRSTWASQIDALADEFTVVAWDASGAGWSRETFRNWIRQVQSTTGSVRGSAPFWQVHIAIRPLSKPR